MAEQQEPNKKSNRIKNLINNRNLLVFLGFVVLSFFLWFLNYLNKDLTGDIVLKYKIKNPPETIASKNASEGEFTIIATGQGYNLLQEKLESKRIPISIDLENGEKADKSGKSLIRYQTGNEKAYIIVNDLKPIIRKKIGDKISINDIKPDTLFFDMVSVVEKTVPIDISNVRFDLIKGQKISNVVLTPDSVTIMGRRSAIDSITKVYVIDDGILPRNKNSHTFKLDIPDAINATQQSTNLSYKVEMFTEAHKRIKIKALNFPPEYNITLLPEDVDVCYNTPISHFDDISDYEFSAIVDYNKAKSKYIEIEVTTSNPFVTISRITPETCCYILETK